MSSTSFRELAGSASVLRERGYGLSGSARLTPIAGGCSESTGQMSLFMTTCEPSAAPHRRDRVWIVAVADAGEPRLSPSECGPLLRAGWWDEGRAAAECGWWRVEPDVGRVAHGVPARVDRLRALGNAIVPQIAEVIGRAIMAREADRCASGSSIVHRNG